MNRQLPERPHIDHLREQAKDLLRLYRQEESEAIRRVKAHHPRHGRDPLGLSDIQLVVAREYGFDSWPKLKAHVEKSPRRSQSESMKKAIRDLREGRCCILFDDEGRENEGDLVLAAERASAEAINFITKFGRGTLCLALTEAHAEKLNLRPINPNRQQLSEPAFLQSVDASSGITTGVSAFDRALTIQAAVREGVSPSDVKSPGHVFPLRAHKDGLRARKGHTEASIELMSLAGLKPAAVICEILKDDGTMARWPDLERFAADHEIQLVRVSDLL